MSFASFWRDARSELRAWSGGSNYFAGSYGVTHYAFDVSNFSTDPRITYVSDAWTGGGLSFPNQDSGLTGTNGRHGFFGGNIELANGQVPEPGIVALLGIGLAGIAASRRRRSAA